MTGPGQRRLRAGLLAVLGAGALAALLAVCLRAGPPGRSSPPPVERVPPAEPAAPDPPAPEPAPPPHAEVELKVTGKEGQVERGDSGGSWAPLVVGDRLLPDEQVRTGPGARADLAAGERSLLSVGERTQLAVRELTEAVHRYRLARGMVAVDYLPDGDRVIRIEGPVPGAPAAEARAARFHVVAGDFSFAVATETGGVTLTAAGGAVDVTAGLAAHALDDGIPSQPAGIPTDVLLKVAEASRVGQDAGCLDASGQADAGALVTVNDVEVPVDQDGRFTIRVPKSERTTVTVRAVLPDGRSAVRALRCWEVADPRIHDLRMRWKNAGR